MAHLDACPNIDNNPFERYAPSPGPVEKVKDKWVVEAIVGERIDRRSRGRGQPQWLIRWKGFGAEYNSWVNKDAVFTPNLVRQFKQRRTRR